jgi:hypothetical protein
MPSQQVSSVVRRNAAKSFWRRLTFLELSIVAVVAGLAIGGVLKFIQSMEENRRAAESAAATEALLARLLPAVDTFAKAQGRFPCPADRTSAGGEVLPCTFEGLAPTRALGLPDELANDGFGNPFVYRLEPGCILTVVSGGRDGRLRGGDDLSVTRSAAELGLPQSACPRP